MYFIYLYDSYLLNHKLLGYLSNCHHLWLNKFPYYITLAVIVAHKNCCITFHYSLISVRCFLLFLKPFIFVFLTKLILRNFLFLRGRHRRIQTPLKIGIEFGYNKFCVKSLILVMNMARNLN